MASTKIRLTTGDQVQGTLPDANVASASTWNGKANVEGSGTPAAVASSGALGSDTADCARSDHAHEGLHSIAKSGSAAIKGDATLSEGTGITLTQNGQNIAIASSSSGHSHTKESKTDWDGVVFEWELAHTPLSGTLQVTLNGLVLFEGSGNDYTLAAKTITFITIPPLGSIAQASYPY